MNDIIIGLLKSNHPLKLKQFLFDKLFQDDIIKTIRINELVNQMEDILSIKELLGQMLTFSF